MKSECCWRSVCFFFFGQLNTRSFLKLLPYHLLSCGLQESYERAKALLKSHAKEHKNLADALLMYETLDAKEIQLVLEGKTLETRWKQPGTTTIKRVATWEGIRISKAQGSWKERRTRSLVNGENVSHGLRHKVSWQVLSYEIFMLSPLRYFINIPRSVVVW